MRRQLILSSSFFNKITDNRSMWVFLKLTAIFYLYSQCLNDDVIYNGYNLKYSNGVCKLQF